MRSIKISFIALFFLLQLTPLEVHQINTRRSYYPSPVGRIFENKLNIQLDRLAGRFFSLLDINRYLFSGHPRENDIRR